MSAVLSDPSLDLVEESSTELAIRQVKTSVAALDRIKAGIAEINKLHPKNLACDLSTTAGMKHAVAGRAAWRDTRVAVEKVRKAAKAPVLQLGKEIDAFAAEVEALLLEGEKNYDDQIKAEESRKAIEKATREQAEREAAAAIQTRIDAIREYVVIPAGAKAAGIFVARQNLENVEITLEAYGDRAGEAQQAKNSTLLRLSELYAAAQEHEAEQARMVAEREELARLRAEQEARDKAERTRIAAEQKAEADRLAAERKRIADEEAAAKAARDKADAEARAARAEEDRVAREARAAEDQRIARERAELEAKQRAQREADEAAAAASARAAQKKADDAAKKERARLDKEAADRRAAEEKAYADDKRMRDAAPAMLDALEMVRDAYDDCQRDGIATIPATARKVIADAIELATGEAA